MIITYIKGGIGNQLYQYAAGRRLAHKLNTELKLDLTFYGHDNLRPYALSLFNIKESIATPKEISAMKRFTEPRGISRSKRRKVIMSCSSRATTASYPTR